RGRSTCPYPSRGRGRRACGRRAPARAGYSTGAATSPSDVLDLHEVAYLPEHACEHRALVVLGGVADATEAERTQRAAVRLALADLGLDLRDLDLGHYDSSFFLRIERRFGFSSAAGVGAGSSAAGAGSGSGSGSGSTATGTAAGSSSTTMVTAAAASSGSTTGFLNGSTSLICLPRIRATSSGRRSSLSATIVAFAMLIGFVVPRLFASTLRTPASSSTARTPPPAMTPVPSEAGRSMTRAASKRP